jgi:hypothetical protein
MAATLKCDTIQNAASATANLTLDTSANATVGGTLAMASSFKRNRIINGNMTVDQRNAGASVTPTVDQTYTIDRWQVLISQASKISVQRQTSVVPTGFTYATKITSLAATSVGSTDYFCYAQPIEGFNVADWSWGTANAQTVTLSFWVYSSLTGTFGGCISNSAQNRAYPFTYSISSANTWTYITKTITGDTTGTWPSDNTRSVWLLIGLGVGTTYSGTANAWTAGVYLGATGATSVVGTNGATFYITGVQLEVGSVATPYERQIFSDQLAQCQRYFQFGGYNFNGSALNGSTTSIEGSVPLNPPMRSAPAVSLTSGVSIQIRQSNVTADYLASSPALANTSTTNYGIWTQISGFTGLTAGLFCTARNNSGASQMNFLSFSSEL